VTYVATELSIPTNGILAGLGLSGLAVAFASKETLSNVFGAGILVADRPFKKGDLITAGDIHGTVEQVGIRSTRIRTSEDTQIVVPNGKLSDASINNWGDRKYRFFQAKIRVAYGAAAAQIEGFMAKLQDMLLPMRRWFSTAPKSVSQH
jgi:MscS family membrane protein